MPILTDFHNHIIESSAYEMARAGQEKGLHRIGLSEHIFQMAEARSLLAHLELEGPITTLPSYCREVGEVAERLQFDIRLGLEVDFIPEKNEALQSLLQGYHWDFLIGSVHEVDGIQFEQIDIRDREKGEKIWRRYCQLLCNAVACGSFDVISHPLRMRVKNPYLPAALDKELELLAAEAARYNVALELNGFDVLTYPELVRRLVAICAVHKTPISIGSDAHTPQKVAQAHQQTEAILREIGIETVRTWKQRKVEAYALSATPLC